ncbi:hypothetical protein HY612_05935 [Candidatus Roizmanbacteria bacterium]|nr:hypothetical protein [Candidatus Roizmanbacteria bacterium]
MRNIPILNKENVEKFAKERDVWKDIKEDIKALKDALEVGLEPKNALHLEHHKLAKKIWISFKNKKKVGLEAKVCDKKNT